MKNLFAIVVILYISGVSSRIEKPDNVLENNGKIRDFMVKEEKSTNNYVSDRIETSWQDFIKLSSKIQSCVATRDRECLQKAVHEIAAKESQRTLYYAGLSFRQSSFGPVFGKSDACYGEEIKFRFNQWREDLSIPHINNEDVDTGIAFVVPSGDIDYEKIPQIDERRFRYPVFGHKKLIRYPGKNVVASDACALLTVHKVEIQKYLRNKDDDVVLVLPLSMYCPKGAYEIGPISNLIVEKIHGKFSVIGRINWRTGVVHGGEKLKRMAELDHIRPFLE